jgi:chromosome segregation ATPase
MDVNQLSQIVNYLDGERRKDKAQLVQLVERVDGLSRELEARTRYAQGLEGTINELKLQISRMGGWNTSIDQLRAELTLNIEREADQRVKSERELVRTRQIEIESIVRQLNEIKKEIKPYGRYAEEISARQMEEARLADLIGRAQVQLMEFERRFDQPAATLSYLEEQRRQDTKRITALEQQWPDIAKRIDQFPPRLLLLDEAIRKKHNEIEEAAKQLEAQKQVIEAQRVADLRRERQFAEYAELIERLKERADEIQNQVGGYYQMRDEVKRELSGLPDFKEQIEVRLNEVIEIQRDAEERAKKIAAAFREEIEKQWKQFGVAQDEKWHDRDRRISEYDGRIAEVEDELPRISVQIPPLYEIFEDFAKSYAQAGRDWLARSNQLLDQAKLNLPSETRPSRRQRRKQQAVNAAHAATPQQLGRPQADDDDIDMEADLLK